jgi:LmbE family N-acetylglucosaminyl deacetylase
LLLGAHCDDIEIGCGATVLRLVREVPDLVVHWIVFSSDDTRAEEAHAGAKLFLTQCKRATVIVKDFRNGFFPYVATEIKEYFETLKPISPDLIFTHHGRDWHQDHRMLAELTWNTFRDHMILEYEIPKYDGDLGSPNFFVSVEQDLCDAKTSHVMETFVSQRDKQWFTEDTFRAVLRLRGIESNSPSGLAEAFYCRKAVV